MTYWTRYYSIPISSALAWFMSNCRLVCYVRDHENWGTAKEQSEFVVEIRKGNRDPNIPREWSDGIEMLSYTRSSSGVDLNTVSSSLIRDLVGKGAEVSAIFGFGISYRTSH